MTNIFEMAKAKVKAKVKKIGLGSCLKRGQQCTDSSQCCHKHKGARCINADGRFVCSIV